MTSKIQIKIQELERDVDAIAKVLEIHGRNANLILDRIIHIESEMKEVGEDIGEFLKALTYKPSKETPSYIG